MRAILAAIALTAAPAFADAPAPGQFGIENAAFRGTGCRPGTVAWNSSPDARALTLLFSDFVVEAGPATQRQMSKVCELDLRLRVPSGWSYALASVDVRGYAQLATQESKGRVHAFYAFGRSPEPELLISQQFKGPYASDYQLHGDAALESLVWSPCGGSRLMRLRTRINAVAPANGSAGALVTVDSVDSEVTQKYALTWKRCPANDPVDTMPLPALDQSFSASCGVNLLRPNGQLLATFVGEGVGMKVGSAKRAAQADGMKQCRKDRQTRPNPGNCVIDEPSCVVSQN